MFVYKLVTSIETSIAFSGIFVLSMKLMTEGGRVFKVWILLLCKVVCQQMLIISL